MTRHIVLDCETRSLLDLRKTGHARYARDPSTDCWCACWCLVDQPVQLWRAGEPVPAEIMATAADPECLFVAHNAGFERAIWQHVLVRHGWPELPGVERWRCTQAAASAMALPPKLDKLAKALSLDHQKAADDIMHLMAKPRAPRAGEDPDGIYWFDDPEHLQQLYDYCLADVECERELFHWLPPLLPAEQELWELDQIINGRGFAVDRLLVEKAIAIATAVDRAVQAELQEITGGEIESTNQVEKLLTWLVARGCELADLQKPTLAAALRRANLAPEVRRVMELRREAAHASANKFQAMRAWCCEDGRIRGAFKYHGAATGRWSANGVQPQNLKKEGANIADKVAAVLTGDIEIVRKLGSPIEVVGDVARAAICAGSGCKLLTADYSAIESRVLAWIAGETSKLAMWARFDETGNPNDDPYVIIGRALGHPEETARAKGKIADLAFGYGGGLGAYKNMAPADDTATEAQIQGFKQAWRDHHPRTVQFWYGIERTAINAIYQSPQKYGRFILRFEKWHGVPFLFIELPSGRRLAYPFARLIRNDRGHAAMTFMDNAAVTGGWTEYRPGRGIWGGTFTENLTQAVARDLLAAAMLRAEAVGCPVVLHVHDSIVCEVPDGANDI
jgi:DNA polymerase